MDDATRQVTWLEYREAIYKFQSAQDAEADAKFVELLSAAFSFIYEKYQEEETVFPGSKFRFEQIMHETYLMLGYCLENNPALLHSGKVQNFFY